MSILTSSGKNALIASVENTRGDTQSESEIGKLKATILSVRVCVYACVRIGVSHAARKLQLRPESESVRLVNSGKDGIHEKAGLDQSAS